MVSSVDTGTLSNDLNMGPDLVTSYAAFPGAGHIAAADGSYPIDLSAFFNLSLNAPAPGHVNMPVLDYRPARPYETVPPVRGGLLNPNDDIVWPLEEYMQDGPRQGDIQDMLRDTCKVVVTRLSRHAGRKELKRYILKAAGGRRMLREDIRFPRPGNGSGFRHAFMTFWTREDAELAVARLDKSVFHEQSIEARFTVETVPPWLVETAYNVPGIGHAPGPRGNAHPQESAPVVFGGSLSASDPAQEGQSYRPPLVVDGSSGHGEAR